MEEIEMKKINVDVLPPIDYTRIFYNDEYVAFGIVDPGILIHYVERDTARLVEWVDILNLGLQDMVDPVKDISGSEGKVIEGPTPE